MMLISVSCLVPDHCCMCQELQARPRDWFLSISGPCCIWNCRQARKLQDMVDRMQGAGGDRRMSSTGLGCGGGGGGHRGGALQTNNSNLDAAFGGGSGQRVVHIL